MSLRTDVLKVSFTLNKNIFMKKIIINLFYHVLKREVLYKLKNNIIIRCYNYKHLHKSPPLQNEKLKKKWM